MLLPRRLAARNRSDVGAPVQAEFALQRTTDDYLSVFDAREPLVSVCIGTYNRGPLLIERSIASILRQTYRRIQLIVVGDHCTDDTERLVGTVSDPRLTFVNLPRRGDYPLDPRRRWAVAGTTTVNHALSLCAGDFITHLDDDDEHEPERVALLLARAQAERADFIFHPFWHEMPGGEWKLNSAEEFAQRKVTTSSVFYHRWFRQIGWDPLAYRYGEPGDWNRFRKFQYLGAKIVREETPLLKHYLEENQRKR